MAGESHKLPEAAPRDAAYWAGKVESLHVGNVPPEAMNLNVNGRQVVGPLQGFGQLWQKTYRITLPDTELTPQTVIGTWKANFAQFWPAGNRFYGPLTGIQPGEVALLNLTMPGGMPLSTGVLVLYADEESFTLMTPQGHMFSGWITFSAYQGDAGVVVQAQVLMRANDPIYEVGLRLGGHKAEDVFWEHTLGAVAKHFGHDLTVQTVCVCVDPKLQWRRARNVWHNAAVRSTMYMFVTPVRSLQRRLRRQV